MPHDKLKLSRIRINRLADAAKEFGSILDEMLPDGRLKDIAFSRLNSLAFLADRAIFDPPKIAAGPHPRGIDRAHQ
jgi:hypothetical protein